MKKLIYQLAAETGMSIPTIRRWIVSPDSVTRPHDYALTAAVGNIGVADELAAARAAHAPEEAVA